MEGNFLLFDSECPRCSAVAGRLRDLDVRDLTVESLHDPRVVELFAQAGRPVPDRPALVHATAHGLTVHTGFAMRMRLARMLGVRRAADIAGLVAMEARAHLARRDEDGEHRLSRRTMLGGTAAGVGALVFGTAAPAAADETIAAGAPLDAATKQRLLARPTFQRGGVWGAADESGVTATVIDGGTRVALVPHTGDIPALTAVSLDDPDTPAITITPNVDGDGIRYFLADSGTPLVEQTVRGDEVVTGELDIEAAPPGAAPAPQGVPQFTACFLVCVGRNITASCVINCVNCAKGGWGAITACPKCAACAGALGVRCARNCAHEL